MAISKVRDLLREAQTTTFHSLFIQKQPNNCTL